MPPPKLLPSGNSGANHPPGITVSGLGALLEKIAIRSSLAEKTRPWGFKRLPPGESAAFGNLLAAGMGPESLQPIVEKIMKRISGEGGRGKQLGLSMGAGRPDSVSIEFSFRSAHFDFDGWLGMKAEISDAGPLYWRYTHSGATTHYELSLELPLVPVAT